MLKKLGWQLSVLFLLILPALATSQIALGLTDEDRAEFARHRSALLDKLGDDVAIIFGAPQREDNLRFRQDNCFYYFTGVEIAFSALILDGRNDSEILFLMPASDNIWFGKTIGPGPEAVAEFGIQDVRSINTLESVLRQMVPSGGRIGMILQREEPVAGSRDYSSAIRRWSHQDHRPPHVGCGIVAFLGHRDLFIEEVELGDDLGEVGQ